MKLGIIGGGGQLGSATAFFAGLQGLVSEIKLFDINKSLVNSHVMDLEQALAHTGTRVKGAGYSDFADCDILLLAASLPERSVSSRNDYLKGNIEIVQKTCDAVGPYCKNAVFITATNPIDVCNYMAFKYLGWDRHKFIGFSSNDTLRMKWALAAVLEEEYTQIDAVCIGEHGEGQVPLFDRVSVGGEQKKLNPGQIRRVKEMTGDWFSNYQKLQCGRSPGWTSAVGLGTIIQALVKGSGQRAIPCSAVLDGEYGERALSIGVPCRLQKDGIAEIVQMKLPEEDLQSFKEAGNRIRDLVKAVS
jgi:malate dehydrogenase